MIKLYDQDKKEVRDVKYTAELCDVCEETVRRWIRRGDLKASINSRKQGFDISVWDLKKFLVANPRYYRAAAYYSLFVESLSLGNKF